MLGLLLASSLNFDLVYILIYLLLLAAFCIAGDNVSRGDSYWKNALICCVLFILVVGTRYERGNDYKHYVDVYAKNLDLHQVLFQYLNTFLRDVMSIGKYFIFYIYAIPFILSGFKFLKNYKKYARWLFPTFFMAMLYFEEYEIRQALSFSFVFLFMDEFMSCRHTIKRKIILITLYSIITLSIHSANLIFLFVFIVTYFFIKKVITYKVTIPLLVFSSYFFSEYYDISYINPILNLFANSGNEKFAHYTAGNAAEAWFGESALQLENARNPLIKFFDLLGNSALFYFSYRYIKYNVTQKGHVLVTLTNLYIIGDIFKQAFLYLEILNRMSTLFQRMWFLPFAIVLYRIKVNKLTSMETLAFGLIFFVLYDFFKYVFAQDVGRTFFLWNI